MTNFKRCMLAAMLAAGLGTANPADALSYVMMSDEALFDQAEGVALFEVIAAEASVKREETRYTVRTLNRFAGPALASTETLVLPGYVGKHTRMVLDGVPFLSPGQRVMLFHARRDDGVLQAMQLTLGMFFPVTDKRHGELYLRYLDAGGNLGAAKNARYAAPRDARAFEAWISRRDAGAQDAGSYLVDLPANGEKYHLIQLNFGNPNFPVGPGRWFQFDTNQSLPWRAEAGGQNAMVLDEFVLLQQGLAAWPADPGSTVQMNYLGTGTAPNGFYGNVRWNDAGNTIPGDYDCGGGGGILGAGGSSANGNRQTFNGTLWYPFQTAFIITQPGAGCFFDTDSGRSAVEFFTHELGHVLGFAHSCGSGSPTVCQPNTPADQATMRSSLHGDSRGGTLQPDDQAAVRFVYPDPNFTEPNPDLLFENGFE